MLCRLPEVVSFTKHPFIDPKTVNSSILVGLFFSKRISFNSMVSGFVLLSLATMTWSVCNSSSSRMSNSKFNSETVFSLKKSGTRDSAGTPRERHFPPRRCDPRCGNGADRFLLVRIWHRPDGTYRSGFDRKVRTPDNAYIPKPSPDDANRSARRSNSHLPTLCGFVLMPQPRALFRLRMRNYELSRSIRSGYFP